MATQTDNAVRASRTGNASHTLTKEINKGIQVGTLSIMAEGIMSIFSGALMPLTVYPKEVLYVISFLPFGHVYFTSLLIYLGVPSVNECLVGIAFHRLSKCIRSVPPCGISIDIAKGVKRFDAKGG